MGVNIFYDGKFLRDKYPQMRVNSRFDLRHLSRYCKVKKESLAALTKALLPFELEKKNILTYKWENALSDEMVKYAALDALAGVLIFDKLLSLFHTQVRCFLYSSYKTVASIQSNPLKVSYKLVSIIYL